MSLVVVFDANVYIDACIALSNGAIYPQKITAWPANQPAAALAAFDLVVSPPPDLDLTIYSDEGLDDLVLRKLTQPTDAARPEDRGLGWSEGDANAAFGMLVDPLDVSGRSFSFSPDAAPDHAPGLDFEDGRVFGLFRAACGERPWCEAILVTFDQQFASVVNGAAGQLSTGQPAYLALSPVRFIAAVLAAPTP